MRTPLMIGILEMMAIAIGMSGCAPDSNTMDEAQVSIRIHQIEALQEEAQSEEDWNLRYEEGENLFDGVQSSNNLTVNHHLCQELLKSTKDQLLSFENQILNPRYRETLSPCLTELQKRLENYYNEYRKDMETKGFIVLDMPPSSSLPPPPPSEHHQNEGSSPDPGQQREEGQQQENTQQFTEPIRFRNTPSLHSLPPLIQEISPNTGRLDRHLLKPKQVILSFDDGPSSIGVTLTINAILKKFQTRGLFFMLGRQVEAYPKMAQTLAKEGHSLGNHSYSHPYMGSKLKNMISSKIKIVQGSAAMDQIRRAQQIIFSITGVMDHFVRFPYGESTPELRTFTQHHLLTEIHWDIDSKDWKPQPPLQIYESVMSQLEKRGRGIILFHDTHQRTAEALPQILQTLAERGYQVVLIRSKDRASSTPLL